MSNSMEDRIRRISIKEVITQEQVAQSDQQEVFNQPIILMSIQEVKIIIRAQGLEVDVIHSNMEVDFAMEADLMDMVDMLVKAMMQVHSIVTLSTHIIIFQRNSMRMHRK